MRRSTAVALALAHALPRGARAASSCAIEPAASVDLIKFRGLAGGAPIVPAALRGRAVLVVNTASYCGYTKQLASLQALHERFAPAGLVVLGVPSNDFGGQEPDAEEKVRATYADAWGVTFPLAGKTPVTGGEAHAFYLHLQHKLGDAGAPPWNFMKYLLGRAGDVVGM